MTTSVAGTFPTTFIDAINRADDEAAKAALAAAATTSTGTLSPRAEELKGEGKWDGKMTFALALLDGKCCNGRINNDESRVCGARNCPKESHKTGLPLLEEAVYQPAGPPGKGFFREPMFLLPPKGPLTSKGAAFLLDKRKPFELSIGRWIFTREALYAPAPKSVLCVDTELGQNDDAALGELLDGGVDDQPPDTSPYSFIGQPMDDEEGGVEEYKEAERDAAVERIVPTRAEAAAANPSARSELDGVRAQLTGLIAAVRSRFEDVDDTIAKLKGEKELLSGELASAAFKIDSQRQQLLRLAQRVLQLETARLNSAAANPPVAQQSDDVERCMHALFDAQGALPTLTGRFNRFVERQDAGGGITAHGIPFQSDVDFDAWFKTLELDRFAVFPDALVFLHAIKLPFQHPDDVLKSADLRRRNELKSSLDAAHAASFEANLPAILAGAQRHGNDMYTSIKAHIKDFKAWDPGSGPTGVSKQVLDGVSTVQRTWLQYQRQVETRDPDFHTLSSGLAMDSVAFCQELVHFLNTQYRELIAGAVYTPDQVWSMSLECLYVILKELTDIHNTYSDSGKYEPHLHAWAALKCWEVQERYRKNNFGDDPALTGVLVRRIILNGGDGGVAVKFQKVDDLVKLVDSHHRQHVNEIKRVEKLIGKDKAGGN
jgi:hypothetical protein